jgi:hypothetical protein
MKTLFFSLIAVGMLFSACHQSTGNSTAGNTTSNAENAPVMKFEKQSHDFGKMAVGDKVSYDFKFTNAGKSPLIISDGYASCGCTKPTWPKTPIKPGENGVIHVTFNSQGKTPGLQDKLITITANTVPAQNNVHLIGELIAPPLKK